MHGPAVIGSRCSGDPALVGKLNKKITHQGHLFKLFTKNYSILYLKKPMQNKQALISFLNAYIDRAHSVALYGRLFHKTEPLHANCF